MPESFTIPSFEAPELSPVDVVVVGGGPAGVAAAIAAGRQGLRTLLIEKYVGKSRPFALHPPPYETTHLSDPRAGESRERR